MLLPNRCHEELLFAQGHVLVAGLDEAGRGPLAGPVVAAAVVLPRHMPNAPWLPLIRDSKTLSSAQRETAFSHIQATALHIGVGMVSSTEIDTWGIASATREAMNQAILDMSIRPHHLLVDGLKLLWQDVPCTPIIHGDGICLPISAASIVAKVTRDRLMVTQDAIFPQYGFAKHKGYGTPHHLDALRHMGPCSLHRLSFAPVRALLDTTAPGGPSLAHGVD